MNKKTIYIIFTLLYLFNSQLVFGSSWKSLIIPGWGEKSKGYDKRGNIFLISELILLSSLMHSEDMSSSYEQDYLNHARYHANIELEGRGDIFAANVGNFNSLYEYNQYKATNGLYDDIYNDVPKNQWNWSSRAKRLQYDTWRNKSKNFDELEGFIIAGLLLNRMISFIDVLILKRKEKLETDFSSSSNSAKFKISYKF